MQFLNAKDAAKLECANKSLRSLLHDAAAWQSLVRSSWCRWPVHSLSGTRSATEWKHVHTARMTDEKTVQQNCMQLCWRHKRMPSCRWVACNITREHAVEALDRMVHDGLSNSYDVSLGAITRAGYMLERLSELEAHEDIDHIMGVNKDSGVTFDDELVPPEDAALSLGKLVSYQSRESCGQVKASLDALAHELSSRLMRAGVGACNSHDGVHYTGEQMLDALQHLVTFLHAPNHQYNPSAMDSPPHNLLQDGIHGAHVPSLREGLGFRSTHSEHYDLRNSDIATVLRQRTGNSVTLCIILIAIGKRVGLPLQPVSVLSHLMCRAGNSEDDYERFIDPTEGDEVFTRNGIMQEPRLLDQTQIATVGTEPLIGQMLNNIVNEITSHPERDDVKLFNALGAQEALGYRIGTDTQRWRRLSLAVSLSDWEHALNDIDRPPAFVNPPEKERVISLERMDREKRARVVRPSLMHNQVLFGVGLVFKHRRLNYRAVIIGYDETCQQTWAWQRQMGVAKLPHGSSQPFYHSLVSHEYRLGEGAQTYVAQVCTHFVCALVLQSGIFSLLTMVESGELMHCTALQDNIIPFGENHRDWPNEEPRVNHFPEVGLLMDAFDPKRSKYVASDALQQQYPEG